MTAGDNDGELDVAWDSLRGAGSYEQQTDTDPNASAGWVARGTSTRSSTTLSGLTSGVRIWVRVRGIGAAGPGAWSAPTGRMRAVRGTRHGVRSRAAADGFGNRIAELRDQFNGLKALIDAVPQGPPGPEGPAGSPGPPGPEGPRGSERRTTGAGRSPRPRRASRSARRRRPRGTGRSARPERRPARSRRSGGSARPARRSDHRRTHRGDRRHFQQ